jgi:hypothetical protein
MGNADTFCYTGIVTISGLTAGQSYSGTIKQGASEVITFSFETQPAGDNFNIFAISCAKHDPQPTGSVWKVLKENIQARTPTALAHIDDLGYFDTLKVASFSSLGSSDPETGLTQTGIPVVTGDSSASNGEDDYIIAWMAWYGMFPQWFTYPGREDYEWCMRNVAHWDQLGDHEYYPDARSHVAIGAVGGAESGQIPNIDGFAQTNWDAFVGDAGPPRTAFTGNTSAWAFECGNVAFASPDFISKAQCYNAMDTGDSGPRGASDSGWYFSDISDPAQWTANYGTTPLGWPNFTKPARTGGVNGDASNNIGHSTDDTPPDYLGSTQATELATFFTGSTAKCKALLSAKRITAHNQPWYDLHPDEWLSYIDTVLNSDACNGVDGHYFHTAGDVHAFAVTKYTANGTTGLGHGNLTGGEVLYEFLCGAITSALGSFGRTLAQGASLEYQLTQPSPPSDTVPQVPHSAFNEMRFSSTGVEVEYIRLPQSTPMTGVYALDYTQNDNEFTLIEETTVDNFGYKVTTPTVVSSNTQTVPANQADACSANDSFSGVDVTNANLLLRSRVYGPATGNESPIISLGTIGRSDTSAATTIQVKLYEYNHGQTFTGPPARVGVQTVASTSAMAVPGNITEPLLKPYTESITPFQMEVGKYYIVALGAGSVAFEALSADAAGSTATARDPAGFNDPFDTTPLTVNRQHAGWADFQASAPPTLTTPYADLINMDGDVVAGVDLNTNITGETSLVVTWYPAIPNGLSESGGVVSGTVTTPTGTTTCTVTGTNSLGSVSDSFQWTTLTIGAASNINSTINSPLT